MSDDLFDSNLTRSPKSKTRARCPACSAWINLSDTAEVWDPVTCPECNTRLEITELRPPTLDYAHDDPADEWDDDDWEDEEWEERGNKRNKRR